MLVNDMGELDNSAIIGIYEKLANVVLKTDNTD
jgi:hypothetical protein